MPKTCVACLVDFPECAQDVLKISDDTHICRSCFVNANPTAYKFSPELASISIEYAQEQWLYSKYSKVSHLWRPSATNGIRHSICGMAQETPRDILNHVEYCANPNKKCAHCQKMSANKKGA
jgi:hypothetical protein